MGFGQFLLVVVGIGFMSLLSSVWLGAGFAILVGVSGLVGFF